MFSGNMRDNISAPQVTSKRNGITIWDRPMASTTGLALRDQSAKPHCKGESFHMTGRKPGKARTRRNTWITPSGPSCRWPPKQEVSGAEKPAMKPGKATLYFFPGVPETGLETVAPVSIYDIRHQCSVLIDGTESKHAPYLCAKDHKMCDPSSRLGGLLDYRIERDNYTALSVNDRTYLHYCTCQISHNRSQIAEKSIWTPMKITMANPLTGQRPSPDRPEYRLYAPRSQARELLPSPSQLIVYPEGVLRRGQSECESPTAIKELVSGELDSLAVATQLVGKTTLCPAMGARMMLVHVTYGGEASKRDTSWPQLGLVMFVFPFPWNSLNVREVTMESGDVLEAGFQVPLPLHVTQHMKPKVQYLVRQEATGLATPLQDNPRVETASQNVSIEYPRLRDGCVIQLELIYAHKESIQCPPAIAVNKKSGPFHRNSIKFTVKGVVFGMAVHFTATPFLRITYNGTFILFSGNGWMNGSQPRKRVSFVVPDVFLYVPYVLEFDDGQSSNQPRIKLFQWGRLLFEQARASGAPSEIEFIQFAVPGLCDTISTGGFNMDAHRKRLSIKVRVTPPNCGPGRCVEYRTGRKYSHPVNQGIRPGWLMNLRPHWSWRQALALYSDRETFYFSEKSVGQTPGDVRVALSQGNIKLTLRGTVGRSTTDMPVTLPRTELPLKEELKRYSRVIQLNFSNHYPGDPRQYDQLGTFAYFAYDQLTLEVGIADLATPFYRSKRGRQSPLFETGLSLDALEVWNGRAVRLLSVQSMRQAALLQYVSRPKCKDADGRVPLSAESRAKCNSNIPACMFCNTLLNEDIERCLKQVKCKPNIKFRHPAFRPPLRPSWPSCLTDSNCEMKDFLAASEREVSEQSLD